MMYTTINFYYTYRPIIGNICPRNFLLFHFGEPLEVLSHLFYRSDLYQQHWTFVQHRAKHREWIAVVHRMGFVPVVLHTDLVVLDLVVLDNIPAVVGIPDTLVVDHPDNLPSKFRFKERQTFAICRIFKAAFCSDASDTRYNSCIIIVIIERMWAESFWPSHEPLNVLFDS